MKKRIFMLAVVVGVLLSLSASAWADSVTYNRFEINDFNVPDTVYDAKVGNTVTVEFDIIVKNYPSTSTNGYEYANLLKWTVGGAAWNDPSDSFEITGVTVTNSGSPSTSATDASDYLFTVQTIEGTGQTDAFTNTLHIAVTGKVLKAGGSLQVKASLYNVSSGSVAVTTSNKDTADVVSGSEQESDEITTSEEWGYSTDPANPDAADNVWDGMDPPFTSDPGDNSVAKAKAKLTTTKFAKDFVSGTASTQTITITGPVTEIDVYVAAKDAIKLGWLEKGATENIQLNKENIKKYNIPFRITDTDFSKNEDVLTGADKTDKTGAKKDKDNAKKMTSTLTLAFNGGYFSYKGFPLTISATNEEMSKPAAKAIKINVTPNANTPVWWFLDTREVTTTEVKDVTNEVTTDETTSVKTIKLSSYSSYTNPKLWGKGGTNLTPGTDGDTYTVTAPADGDTVVMLSYDVTSEEEYKHVIDPKNNKADKNIEVPVSLVEGDEQGVIPLDDPKYVYYISGDYGPFTITAKGDGKNGVTANVTQPTFNYRGEINKNNNGGEVEGGYVSFSGTLEKTDKESKTGVTLTVTNPSTKKKGTAKINVVGKLPAAFDTKKYPVSTDISMKVLATKYVEAGKIPSVKVKATGTKTIVYEASGENSDGLELKDVGLSFDTAKGAVVSLVKGKKDTTPTVKYEDEYTPVFDPIPLTITANNGVGEDEVLAKVGITGAKPKLTTKTVTFSKTEHVVGTYKELAANAGKSAPKYDDLTANIEVTLADDTDTTLEDLGLKLATWKDLPNYVSGDSTLIADGATILNSGETDVFTLYYTTTDADTGDTIKHVLSANDYTRTNDDGDTVADFTTKALPEGATAGTNTYLSKGVKDDGEGYLPGRNKAYIMVEDVEKMNEAGAVKKKKVNLIVSNIGATNKASVTITIEELPSETTTASALPGSNKAAAEAAKKTNGTAGLTYNGALPEADADAKAEEDAAKAEKLTIGAPRTAADLTAGQQAFLAEKGLKVIAVLPEITANVEGQHRLEDVELDEDAPEDATLIWVAFPKNAPASEDDDIVDFYDEAGAPVEGVPASHKIIAYPWLREAVTYEPVIAIEAK